VASCRIFYGVLDSNYNAIRAIYYCTEFDASAIMFLTNPTIAELRQLDLVILMGMLSRQTEEYIELFKENGFTARTLAARELLHNIQDVIELKRVSERLSANKKAIIPSGPDFVQGDQKLV
jgi:hypothetical protein